MSFFGNAAINRLNLHSAIQTLAENAGGVFVLVYLLNTGVSAPLTLCVMAAMNIGRLLLRPLVLPLARRIGLKSTVILGALVEAASYPLLPLVEGPGVALAAVIILSPIGSVFYWTGYHAYFAALSDDGKRGAQVGAREAAMTLAGIAGPWLAFGAAAAIQALSVLPLIGAPALTVTDETPGGAAETRLGTALMACEGVFAGGAYFVWQVALFVALERSFTAYGGAMALAALAGAAVSLTVGRYIDAGRGRPLIVIGFAMIAGLVLFRSLGLEQAWVAVAANAMGALAFAFWTPVIGAVLYDLASATPCPLRYSVATETGWDLGSAGACLAGAAMLALGLGYAAAILIALLGATASFGLLWRRYGAEARAT
jgi:hypothetical protein